jgi:hypothetical protein
MFFAGFLWGYAPPWDTLTIKACIEIKQQGRADVRNMLKIVAWAILMSALLAGCTWVKPTPEGEKVVVLSAAEVQKCKRLGHTTVSVLSKVAGVERHKEKVEAELKTLARNTAAEIGGDAVVPESEIKDGQQRFGVYRCRP